MFNNNFICNNQYNKAAIREELNSSIPYSGIDPGVIDR